jgi:hypothetical protein
MGPLLVPFYSWGGPEEWKTRVALKFAIIPKFIAFTLLIPFKSW